jgi:signal transduction histidine kinase
VTRATARRRTLLVDDADELRGLLRLVLERSGRYEVVGEAGDGRAAIDAAAAHADRLDLILLDLSMPRMDGLEALPHLRRVAPAARVVVLSGFAEPGTAAAARSAGADLYLEKGLAPDALLAALDATAIPAGQSPPSGPRQVRRPTAAAPPTSEVVGRLAHDVRTPLTTARGAVALVREQLGARDPELAEVVGHAETSLDRVERTLAAAVEHARVGAAPLTPRRVEVRDVAIEAVSAVGPRAGSRVSVRGPSRHALADREALRRIVSNLVDNAVRYSDGPVEVTVLDAGDDLVGIEVRDHGPGLGADASDLFAPFVRGATSRGRPGSGLGLATAAELVRRLGGDLTAGDDPGGGAVLRVQLPAG